MLLSPQLAVSCLVAAPICYYILWPLVLYFQDPLRLGKYPAPNFLAAITPLWLLRTTWSQSRSRELHKEFQRLGDVIRVSPNHIIFNSPAAIKDIYGVLAISRGVAKDDFYDRLAGSGPHDLVLLRDRGEHSNRRKAIANAFAAKTVVQMEAVIRKAACQLILALDRSNDDSKRDALNLRKWLNYFTLDVIGDTGFGQPMGFLENASDATFAESKGGKSYPIAGTIDTLHRGVRYSLAVANITSSRLSLLVRKVVTSIHPLATRLGSIYADDFENICLSQLRKRIADGPPARASGDFMSFILADKHRGGDSQDGQTFTQEQLGSLLADSVMMMNAGSDTTAAALTSTVWFLLQNKHALDRLRDELAPLAPSSEDGDLSAESSIFAYDTVKDLPYLRACIDESLRLRPPIAYQLPRLVSRPVNIAGHDILPGTVVAVAPYSVHRHASLYKDPEEYRPERWVDLDKDFPDQRDDLKKYNIVFSQGSRACVGRHLAIVELQILISTLFMRYDFELTDDSAKELKVYERFNSNPGPMPLIVKSRAG